MRLTHEQAYMNILAFNLATNPLTGLGETPLRDSFVLVLLATGIISLSIGLYLLFSTQCACQIDSLKQHIGLLPHHK